MTVKTVDNGKTKVLSKEEFGAFCARLLHFQNQVYAKKIDLGRAMDLVQSAFEPEIKSGEKPQWLAKMLEAESKCHLAFFDQEFYLTEFENKLRGIGRKKIREWKKFGLEPHWLPGIVMNKNSNFSGWKIKPQEFYFHSIEEGRIFIGLKRVTEPRLAEGNGLAVLIDTRLKPVYNDGKQMYQDDNLLGEIIVDLRQSGKIQNYNLGQSRFNVSAKEWEKHVKSVLAVKLGLSVSQVRLETTMERNVISQLYPHMARKDDHQTDTSVWCEEYFEDRDFCLLGGSSARGGLAGVDEGGAGCHWDSRSFRPLAVL